VLTWSFEGQDASPQVLILRGDAQMQAAPAAVYRGAGQRGACLAVIPSRSDFAVGFLESGARSIWRAFELRDDGSRAFDVSVALDPMAVGCVSSAPTPRGYVLAYQNNDGTFFADYNMDKGTVNSGIVAGVLQFGGVARQPKIGCVAPMGSEFSLLFERSSGPEVWRVNGLGDPQGKSIVLPSATGNVGPLSAVPGRDAFVATYLDQGSASVSTGNVMANSRQFVRVDCPMAAPIFVPDAGLDAAVVDGK
jgi:hypothetical protein